MVQQFYSYIENGWVEPNVEQINGWRDELKQISSSISELEESSIDTTGLMSLADCVYRALSNPDNKYRGFQLTRELQELLIRNMYFSPGNPGIHRGSFSGRLGSYPSELYNYNNANLTTSKLAQMLDAVYDCSDPSKLYFRSKTNMSCPKRAGDGTGECVAPEICEN